MRNQHERAEFWGLSLKTKGNQNENILAKPRNNPNVFLPQQTWDVSISLQNQANDPLYKRQKLSEDNFITLTCWKISWALLKAFYWLLFGRPPAVNKTSGQIKPLAHLLAWSEDDAAEEELSDLNYPKIGGRLRECENHQAASWPQVAFFVKLEKLYFICLAPLCPVLISRPFFISIVSGFGRKGESRKNFCRPAMAFPFSVPFFYNNGKQGNRVPGTRSEYLWASLWIMICHLGAFVN